MNPRRFYNKKAHPSPDYFGEALRILDNDMTLEPQREHLAALWGLVVGLTRKLTQAVVECQDDRSATVSTHCRVSQIKIIIE
ncbi:MAG: hypothetical protein K8F29_11010 [Kofleriaceae bacterium]|nr:hypothetical protein [Candidatus Methylomirabilis lanthanidiphila]